MSVLRSAWRSATGRTSRDEREVIVQLERTAESLVGSDVRGDEAGSVPMSRLARLRRIHELLDDLATRPAAPSVPAAPPMSAAPPPVTDNTPSFIFEIIRLRDALTTIGDSDEPDRRTLLRLVDRSLSRVLATAGVESLDQTDRFDAEHQRVVDTTSTGQPSLDGLVAATVRPGYTYQGLLLRPQDVVVYKG